MIQHVGIREVKHEFYITSLPNLISLIYLINFHLIVSLNSLLDDVSYLNLIFN